MASFLLEIATLLTGGSAGPAGGGDPISAKADDDVRAGLNAGLWAG